MEDCSERYSFCQRCNTETAQWRRYIQPVPKDYILFCTLYGVSLPETKEFWTCIKCSSPLDGDGKNYPIQPSLLPEYAWKQLNSGEKKRLKDAA